MSEFALSTSWNASRHKDARAIIDEIKACGFDSVELNFTLTREIVDDISSMVKKGQIRVRSLHNYCPIPDGVKPNQASPDYYSLASLDEDERKKAVFFTKKTIEEAQELGAEAIVLHCGRVRLKDPTRKLMSLFEVGERGSEEFIDIKESMSSQRRLSSRPHLEKALKSLDELSDFAQKRDVILGIENRIYFMEIPSLEEIALILKKFKGSTTYYWHDVGHAQVFEELGFANHEDFLQNYGSQMAGIHFHDIRGVEDHLAPGRGNFDFSVLKPYIKGSVIKIIEAHRTETIEDVKYAREYLSRVFQISDAG